MYTHAVGRSQTRFTLPRLAIFQTAFEEVIEYHPVTDKVRTLRLGQNHTFEQRQVGWQCAQIGKMVVQILPSTEHQMACNELTSLRNSDTLVTSQLATSSAKYRRYTSLCNLADRFLVVSGGYYSARVNLFDTLQNKWLDLPFLVETRWDHASCAAGDAIYVFSGETGERRFLTSIERLDVSQVVAD